MDNIWKYVTYVTIFAEQKTKKMAKPIKPTPTLTGRDAELFHKNMNTRTYGSDEKARILSAFKAISFDKPKSKA